MKSFVKYIHPVDDVYIKIMYYDGILRFKCVRKTKNSVQHMGGLDLTKFQEYSEGWNQDMLLFLKHILETLSYSTRSGCIHQHVLKWGKKLIEGKVNLDEDKSKIVPKHGDKYYAAYITPDEHPEGLLGRKCPICGTPYGMKLQNNEIHEDLLDWLYNLPDSKEAQNIKELV